MKYRKDVDGLRSIAVLPVILYHAGISAFSGGYVGVDIFFVISGYLITGLISAEMADDRFMVSNFYVRRIKRIFPALYFMLIFSLILSAAFLLPKHLMSFGKSMISTVFFCSNLFFWKQSGYFAAAAESKPLLHTWSLGVEEQFYIFFPLFLWWLYKRGKNIKTAVFAVFVVSFVLSAFLTPRFPESSFYMLHTRAWELMLGSLIALGAFPSTDNKYFSNLLSAAGFALICFAVFAFNKETVFPGYSAMIPCLGAGLIIYSGLNNQPVINRILGIKPLVFIGLVSYSLYLWHWPLIAMRNYYRLMLDNSFITSNWFIIGATFFFAVFSYYVVEKPLRTKKVIDKKGLFRKSAYVMATFTILGCVVYFTKGFPERMPDGVNKITHIDNSAYRNNDCFYYDPMKTTEDRLCRMGDKKGKPSFILWGDSHALSLTDGFNDLASQSGLTGVFAGKSNCPPMRLVKIYSNGTPSNCRQFNDIVFGIITKDKNIKDVFLAARWELYSNSPAENDNMDTVRLEDGITKSSSAGNEKIFKDGVMRTVKGLVKAGKNVYFVMDVPEVPYEAASELGKQEYMKKLLPGRAKNLFAYVPLKDYMDRNNNVLETLKLVQDKTKLKRLDVYKVMCENGKCALSEDGQSLYLDSNHLSRFGSKYVVKSYSDELKPLFSK